MACYDALALEFSSRMVSRRTQRRFATALALLFAASAAGTILLCSSMSQMSGMSMPGGWIMSMTWMRMRSQTWLDAGASFLLMWVVMMVAMMLPSLAPMVVQYRQSVASAAGSRLGRLTALVTLAYFFVWTAIGIVVYPLGILLANYEMHYPALSHAVPLATGIVVLLAGAFQLTTWKSRLLAHCHDVPSSGASPAAPRSAWRHDQPRHPLRLLLR